jgi:hypothetical protein
MLKMVAKSVAPLSYTSQYGYYGLRVNPTFDQVLRTVRKPLRIPVPDRHAKWFALGPYRSLILDAEAKFNEHQHTQIDFRQSGHELPEAAAAVRRSDAGADPVFPQIHAHGEAMNAYDTQNAASQLMHAERKRQSEHNRSQVLYQTHGVNLGDPVIQAAFDELDEAQAYHTKPAARPHPIESYRLEAVGEFAAAGQPQAPAFTPFGELNLGEPHRVRAGKPVVGQASSYEQLKQSVHEA